ncbi:Tn3 family transposase [Nocardia rhamnosiphila]|uniref:Tn3 family transposase n=1 Tax=Nocardia rhamnosiphila TaxID=426716 RepID=UPI0033C6424A
MNCVVLWNTVYLDQAVGVLREQGYPVLDADVARLSAFIRSHLGLDGHYSFVLPSWVGGCGRCVAPALPVSNDHGACPRPIEPHGPTGECGRPAVWARPANPDVAVALPTSVHDPIKSSVGHLTCGPKPLSSQQLSARSTLRSGQVQDSGAGCRM